MLDAEIRDHGRHVRAEPEKPGRLDRVRRDDFWRCRALRAAVQGDQAEGGRRGVLPLRLPHSPHCQHAPHIILVSAGSICQMHILILFQHIL